MAKLKRCPSCGRKRPEPNAWSDEAKLVQPAKGKRKALTMRFYECPRCRFEIALVLSGKRRKQGKKMWKAIFHAIAKECKE